jgi:KaiC/GvpD/RAD55 family RecA-like ATPase
MVEQDSVVLHGIWCKWYKPTLDELFKEFESAGFWLTPDAAIEEMEKLFNRVLGRTEAAGGANPKNDAMQSTMFRFDHVAMTCEAHHYAVDLFYKYYFPRTPESKGKARRGTTRLPEKYLDRILKLLRRGKNYVQIAQLLGQPKDRMRHQVEIAEARFREVAARVRKLGAAQWSREFSGGPIPKTLNSGKERRQRSNLRTKSKK